MIPLHFNRRRFGEDLLNWFQLNKRDLPWRRTRDPYRIWLSEIMLQQTRVVAVVPYYERFLVRFPDVESLASAAEEELLRVWAGLGYYSRARNLQKAARQIADLGEFPSSYDLIRALPGVGEYTAAAVASIAFGLPHAAVDGNVTRVLSRVAAQTGSLRSFAGLLIAGEQPGDFNQAMMELGATLCLPRHPRCLVCPVANQCEARRLGRQDEFPAKRVKPQAQVVKHRLLLIEERDAVLLWQRSNSSQRMRGFWELPVADQIPTAKAVRLRGRFRHTIVNTNYLVEVVEATLPDGQPEGFYWQPKDVLSDIALSTIARKALNYPALQAQA